MSGHAWLSCSVYGQISWPKERASFGFGDHDMLAIPATERYGASIHVNLQKSRLEFEQGLSIANQVLSLVAWKEDAPAILGDGWGLNPEPIPIPRRAAVYPASSRWRVWPHRVAPLSDEAGRQAIAFYREARSLESYGFLTYAVLGYYKMLEIKFKDGRKRGEWLENIVDLIITGQARGAHLGTLTDMFGNDAKGIAKFLQCEGRQAVAHAANVFVNPDDVDQVRRMSLRLNPLRGIAMLFIRDELDVRV